jgi:hypothetical protein
MISYLILFTFCSQFEQDEREKREEREVKNKLMMRNRLKQLFLFET